MAPVIRDSAFIRASEAMMWDCVRRTAANIDAAMLGRPLPYPPVPRGPEPNFDDPCDDWSAAEDDDPDW